VTTASIMSIHILEKWNACHGLVYVSPDGADQAAAADIPGTSESFAVKRPSAGDSDAYSGAGRYPRPLARASYVGEACASRAGSARYHHQLGYIGWWIPQTSHECHGRAATHGQGPEQEEQVPQVTDALLNQSK